MLFYDRNLKAESFNNLVYAVHLNNKWLTNDWKNTRSKLWVVSRDLYQNKVNCFKHMQKNLNSSLEEIIFWLYFQMNQMKNLEFVFASLKNEFFLTVFKVGDN